jgi:hypothetical protein
MIAIPLPLDGERGACCMPLDECLERARARGRQWRERTRSEMECARCLKEMLPQGEIDRLCEVFGVIERRRQLHLGTFIWAMVISAGTLGGAYQPIAAGMSKKRCDRYASHRGICRTPGAFLRGSQCTRRTHRSRRHDRCAMTPTMRCYCLQDVATLWILI